MELQAAVVSENEKLCAHHWVINGKNSGVCGKCGAKKHFPVNWLTRSRAKAKKE